MTKTQTLSKSAKVTVASLDAKRIAQEGRLAKMRSDQTAAILNDTEFDPSQIGNAESELKAIVAAQLTLTELEKQFAAKEAARLETMSDEERRKNIAAAITTLEKQRIGFIRDMENALYAFASAYKGAEQSRSDLHVALMSQGTSCTDLMQGSQSSRIGQAMSAMLKKETGVTRIGNLVFGESVRDAALPWVESEGYVTRDVDTVVEALSQPLETEGA